MGNVVTTQKVEKMTGRKLLVIEPMCLTEDHQSLAGNGLSYVAVDTIGAGCDDLVLVTQGSSSRMTTGTLDAPVDCMVIGIIDAVSVVGREVYRKDPA
jgi:ethanolamine utilization protein EutN